MIASCGFLEDELRQYSKEEGVTMADSVETLGVDLRTRVKRLGATERASRKKCKVKFSIAKKKNISKELHEGGGQAVVTIGYGASEDVGGARSGFGPCRTVEDLPEQ